MEKKLKVLPRIRYSRVSKMAFVWFRSPQALSYKQQAKVCNLHNNRTLSPFACVSNESHHQLNRGETSRFPCLWYCHAITIHVHFYIKILPYKSILVHFYCSNSKQKTRQMCCKPIVVLYFLRYCLFILLNSITHQIDVI